MDNPNLFIITGGPGFGKTAVLLELEKRGLRYAPEIAREIIQEQVRCGGQALPWEEALAFAVDAVSYADQVGTGEDLP